MGGDPVCCQSHPIEAALQDDFKAFLEARSKAIHEIALKMTGWV